MGLHELSFVHMQGLYQAQTNANFLTGPLKIVFGLDMHPVTGAVTEVISEPDRGVGTDGAFAKYDFIDSTWWHLDRPGKFILAEIIGSQVLIK